MSIMGLAFASTALIVNGSSVAHADVANEIYSSPDISGSWVFETGKYNRGTCSLSGRMTIKPTNAENQYTCEFTTFEKCPGQYGEVEQACDLLVDGQQAAFVSEIVRIAKQTPRPYDYAPDDWRLTIKSNDEMLGTLESASRAYVIFKRDSAPIS